MKKLILYLCLVNLITCTTGVNSSVSNAGIDPKISAELNSIETTFIDNIKAGNYEQVKDILSESLTNSSNDQLKQFLSELSASLSDVESSIIDQYHVQNSAGEQPTTLFSSVDSTKGYICKVKPINKEAFLSLRKIQREPTQLLLITMYTKYDTGWKLDMVNLGEYSVLNKNAQSLHLEAQQEYQKGNLLNASNLIFLSSQVSKPSGELYTYKNFDEMEQSFNKIMEELKSSYEFPISFDDVSTKPKIVNFGPEILMEGIIPTVAYQTAIPIADTIRLKEENTEIHNKIETVLSKVKANNQYIIYKAINEIPDGIHGVESYTFVKENAE